MISLDQARRTMRRTADFGGEGDCYRWRLARWWDPDLPELVTVMLNPSTADAEKDDPTIRTLVGIAHRWGYGGIRVINLYAYRTPSPAVLFAAPAEVRIGYLTQRVWHDAIHYAERTRRPILAAWGNHGQRRGALFAGHARLRTSLVCLGTTLSGAPKHPLARGRHRIRADQQPIDWRAAA